MSDCEKIQEPVQETVTSVEVTSAADATSATAKSAVPIVWNPNDHVGRRMEVWVAVPMPWLGDLQGVKDDSKFGRYCSMFEDHPVCRAYHAHYPFFSLLDEKQVAGLGETAGPSPHAKQYKEFYRFESWRTKERTTADYWGVFNGGLLLRETPVNFGRDTSKTDDHTITERENMIETIPKGQDYYDCSWITKDHAITSEVLFENEDTVYTLRIVVTRRRKVVDHDIIRTVFYVLDGEILTMHPVVKDLPLSRPFSSHFIDEVATEHLPIVNRLVSKAHPDWEMAVLPCATLNAELSSSTAAHVNDERRGTKRAAETDAEEASVDDESRGTKRRRGDEGECSQSRD
jgi:hypothetical protein